MTRSPTPTTSAELRERFLSFFAARGHARVPSDSLIPSGDPTVLFTSAGMNQFKDCFLGKRTDISRAASAQKCLRTGDLEQVGKTPSHHSFFEMLGNFSFGDYFKPEAIGWAWEFLTGTLDDAGTRRTTTPDRCLSLPASKLWVSVYEEDDEAFTIWRALGVPAARIRRFGAGDNFWPANAQRDGPNGPCGPCSEIYYDPEGAVAGPTSVEVWNLVFTQYDRQPDGTLKPLPRKSIDTGMGLERLARVVQGVESDYETDLFAPIIQEIGRLPHLVGVPGERLRFVERAIADHLRAIVFLILDGVLPSNESRGYILRMLIRRAHRLGRTALPPPLGRPQGFLAALGGAVEQAMRGSPYEHALAKKRDVVRRAIEQEETQCIETLQAGTARVDEVVHALGVTRVIPGDEAFKLYDTYGFPLELTVDLANERGFTVDRAGFEAALKAQQARSRAGSQFRGDVFATETLRVRQAVSGVPPRDALFVGYASLQSDARILGLWDGASWVQEARAPQTIALVLDRSPFYGESGGQIGDAGWIEGPTGRADVAQTAWSDDVLVHQATVSQGVLRVQEPVRARVDEARRLQVARSHTAAHLLHWALRRVLGEEATQAGSLVEAERVRFDVTSLKALREEQRAEVEALVNGRVRLGDPVQTDVLPLEEAKRAGAISLFGEKYGSRVRVVTIGDYSKELCGGTHVAHTGFVGPFVITAESSIAAGTRRLEALVGGAAARRHQESERWLREAARRLGRAPQDLVPAIEELLEQLKQGERARAELQQVVARVEARRLVAEGKRVGDVTLVVSTVKGVDAQGLSVLADAIRQALPGEGVVVLASAQESSRVAFIAAATGEVSRRLHAGQLVKAIAPLCQGSGGGRPDFAQAGGKDPAGIPAALRRAEELIREAVGASG